MSKWNKLNKEFDDVLDNLTKEDWQKWDKSRKEFKKKHQTQLLIESLKCEQAFILCEAELSPPESYEFDKILGTKKSPINSGISVKLPTWKTIQITSNLAHSHFSLIGLQAFLSLSLSMKKLS